MKTIWSIMFCHLVGDYVLQNDFIAKSKGTNWYHLLVHCFLYCLPFCVCAGFDSRLYILLLTHIVIDSAKARYKKIGYITDQVLHYVIAFVLYYFVR